MLSAILMSDVLIVVVGALLCMYLFAMSKKYPKAAWACYAIMLATIPALVLARSWL